MRALKKAVAMMMEWKGEAKEQFRKQVREGLLNI